ncbi:hypothetical protein [Pradoshia sp.]
MGEMWSKGGRSPASPSLVPGKRYEGWEKCGQKAGEPGKSHPCTK